MAYTGAFAHSGLRPLVRPLVRWARRRALTRIRFAQAGLCLGVIAAVWFTEADLRGALVGSAFAVLFLATDAVGAELDRGAADALTAWLVAVLGRLRDYVLYLGLAIGGAITGVPDIWAWAAGALIMHALRDSVLTARAARPGTGVPIPDIYGRGAPRPSRAAPGQVPAQRGESGADSLSEELFSTDAGAAERRGPRRRPRRAATPGAAPEADSARPARTSRPARTARGDRLSDALRRPASFPDLERVAVIAITVTIWDCRVTFIALIVGFVIATASGAADRTAAG